MNDNHGLTADDQSPDRMEALYRADEQGALRIMESGRKGLTSEEAARRLETYGRNVLPEKKGKPVILVFLANFVSLMAILLWVGGIIAFLRKCPNWP